MKRLVSLVFVFVLSYTQVLSVHAWSNGGWSTDPANPKYGTHDWISQHALDWLPTDEKQSIINNLEYYLYGTELPDNGYALDGIGDTTMHHVYYFADGSLQDDSSAMRAQQEYDVALGYAKAGDWVNASKALGIMTHYICDVGVFGHVMGTYTDWGAEVHHSDYEDYVLARTNSYTAEFNSYLIFDGALNTVSARDAALALAFNTTFGDNGRYNCTWLDQNYNWNNSWFRKSCGESLNLAVNLVSDVLHTFHQDVAIPEYSPRLVLPLFIIMTLIIATFCKRNIPRKKASPI